MATLRNKRKLAAVTRETQEEHPRNGQSRNTSVPRINEEYITQVSEEIEGRVTKKLSKEFSRTESRILGALSKLDEFLLNPQIRTHSGTVPGTFRNTNVENQGTNADDSQSDPHPEAGIFRSQTTQNSVPEVGHDMVTGATEQIRNGHDMMTGVQKESLYGPDMVTEVKEENPNRHEMVTGGSEEFRNGHDMVAAVQKDALSSSHGDSSSRRDSLLLLWNFLRKTKKAHSTSQPQFPSENTPATIEADQILLALQQLASNNNSTNFINNNNRTSKLPKSLTTTMPTFDGKSDKFELFEDLFRTSLKIHTIN